MGSGVLIGCGNGGNAVGMYSAGQVYSTGRTSRAGHAYSVWVYSAGRACSGLEGYPPLGLELDACTGTDTYIHIFSIFSLVRRQSYALVAFHFFWDFFYLVYRKEVGAFFR